MSVAKYFLFGGIALFAAVGVIGVMKRPSARSADGPLPPLETSGSAPASSLQEVQLPPRRIAVSSGQASSMKAAPPAASEARPVAVIPAIPLQHEALAASEEGLPDADRIGQLYATDSSKLPIVETISYTSRVPWIQGRPAWIADYASHYGTSRHFIARSLNKKADYLTQKIAPGDRFNVFKKDKNLQFHLVADLSRCRMWFYYVDMDQNERVLLKTYPIGIGRVDAKRKSGYLTPSGKYLLGDKVALYKPGSMGYFQDQQTEMIRVFGTRWIPFGQELEGCTEQAKGYGLHGAPWVQDPQTHQWSEDRTKIGKYESDGCIRLLAEDIEEIFSIIITKPTTIELVKDFREAKLPGIEKKL